MYTRVGRWVGSGEIRDIVSGALLVLGTHPPIRYSSSAGQRGTISGDRVTRGRGNREDVVGRCNGKSSWEELLGLPGRVNGFPGLYHGKVPCSDAPMYPNSEAGGSG